MPNTPLTRQHFARHLMQQLSSFGIGDAPAEARMLADHLFSQQNSTSALHAHENVPEALQTAAGIILSKRQTGQPLAYILGEAYFYNRPFFLQPDVLIPRQDSETLIEAVKATYPDPKTPLHITDVGLGSGNLLITLLLEYPNAISQGTDIAAAPITTTTKNLARYNLSARATVTQHPYLPTQSTATAQHIPIIISNPPYIAADDPDLDASTAHEPRTALIAANNGLSVYEKLIPRAKAALSKSTLASGAKHNNLFLEIGHTQAPAVTSILQENGFHAILLKNDLAERPRTLCATA